MTIETAIQILRENQGDMTGIEKALALIVLNLEAARPRVRCTDMERCRLKAGHTGPHEFESFGEGTRELPGDCGEFRDVLKERYA